MIISDLNYLEVANEEVVGGILLGVLSGNAVTTLVVNETVNINKVASSNVAATGYFGSAQAEVIGLQGAAQTTVIITNGYIASTAIAFARP